jgi:multidrug transporter EmrE-like cation transporter
VVMLVPAVSAAVADFRVALIWGGLGIIVRVMIVWYLYQEPIRETFTKS